MATLSPQGPFRAFSNNGLPLNGGKLYTYEAGTSTPKATFTTSSGSVSNANPVILNSSGYADVWLGSGGYKFILKDSLDNTLWTLDNIIGAIQNTFAGVVVPTSANLPITTLNLNNMILCTATLTLSLPAASVAGQGFIFTVSNAGTGIVTVDPSGAELINSASTFMLLPGESALIVCDGVQWYTAFNSSGLNSLGTDVASATTTDIGLSSSDFVTITGTTTITSFGAPTAFGRRHLWLVFASTVTVTHNATSLILPGGVNYTTSAGDVLEVVNISGSNWRVVGVSKNDGTPYLTAALNTLKGSDIASAATTNIASATGNYVHITGTVSITSFGTAPAGSVRTVRFAGVLTLTYNATSMILPGAANITTATDDVGVFVSEGSGNWRCVSYTRAPVVPYTLTTTLSGTSTTIGTGMPAGLRRIEVIYKGISTSGSAADFLIQLGDSGGIETTSYTSTAGNIVGGTAGTTSNTTGFLTKNNLVGDAYSGQYTISLNDSATNTWTFTGMSLGATNNLTFSAGEKSLSSVLTQMAITTVGGTATFDNGSVVVNGYY